MLHYSRREDGSGATSDAPGGDVIRETRELPSYERVLNSLLPQEWHSRETEFLGLDVGDGTAALLMTPEMWGGHAMHSFERALRLQGYRVVRYQKIARDILQAIVSGDLRDQRVSQAHGDSEAIRGFDELVAMALKERASDIHFERRDAVTRIRMRIFGELFQVAELSNEAAENIVRVALTVLGDEGNKPQVFSLTEMQQASVTRKVAGITVKLRAQSVPAYTVAGDGQDVVFRVLPMAGNMLSDKSLHDLGYLPEQVEILEQAKSSPMGGLFISGVTGSGKSTTLDNLLRSIIRASSGRKKIFTVEDPNEFVIPDSTQVPVARIRTAADNPFADAMRAAMRGDPDFIMVGEVRDEASAQLLQRMVMSGHAVLTTLHTGSAHKIPARLHDLGIERTVLGSPDFFSALVYQRLLPVLCPSCSVPFLQSEEAADQAMVSRIIRIAGADLAGVRARGAGCARCKRGIVSRTVCAEVIAPDYTMVRFFREGREIDAIRHWRGQTGIRKTALGSAVAKMKGGSISPRELEDAFGKGTYLRELELT